MPDDGYERLIRNYPLMRISLQYCEPRLKTRLIALYGLLESLENCLIRASDPVISRAKLSWWCDELHQARTKPGSHPVTVSLQRTGALSCWSPNLIDELLALTLSRIDAPGLGDEGALRALCQSIGMMQFELEASLYDGFSPELTEPLNGSVINGFMQILRESYLAKLATFYWVPLTTIAHSGVSRSHIAENRGGTESRHLLSSVLKRLMIRDGVEPVISRMLRDAEPALAARWRHWFILVVLQQRQLQRLKRKLEVPEFTGDITSELLAVKMSDGWAAWRAARRWSTGLKEVQS